MVVMHRIMTFKYHQLVYKNPGSEIQSKTELCVEWKERELIHLLSPWIVFAALTRFVVDFFRMHIDFISLEATIDALCFITQKTCSFFAFSYTGPHLCSILPFSFFYLVLQTIEGLSFSSDLQFCRIHALVLNISLIIIRVI